jgi:hypothetical protein
LAGCAHPLTDTQTAKVRSSQADPGNTTYLIEGREVQLVDGRDVTEIVPGAASKTVTQVFSQPVYGDVDGKGEADAALILVQTGGGSGTFYYAAAVLNAGSAWQGTNTVLLGDRIDPHDITIRKSLIIVTYNDRRLDEPMISTPTVEVTKYLSVEDGKLKEIAVGDGGSVVVEGWVIMGHEVHSFQPCQEDSDLWLLGISPALSEIMVEYRQAAADSPPYRPILMVLGGINAPRPRHGFGADYEAAFLATELIKIAPEEHCPNALIRIDSPAPGAQISFPLTVTGQARGNWFFEGDFPLLLTDSMGRTLAEDYASAQGPWMTEEFVPFTGTLKSPERSFNSWGWLILKKDNPSERRELDDAVKIPLFFK